VRNAEASLITAATTSKDLLDIIKGAFLDMPGLLLTRCQFRRLWGLDASTCDEVIKALLESHFLVRTPDGNYGRNPSDD
jgi:hypothetical protein